jgi:hypothetical protein
MFNANDLKQFTKKGIEIQTVEMQIKQLTAGFPFINIIKAATDKEGVFIPAEKDFESMIKLYESSADKENILKFVPASGAASRMFKTLYEFMDNRSNLPPEHFDSPENFFEHLKLFAFYDDLMKTMSKLTVDENKKEIVNTLLNEHGLNYGNLPKGLLKFHCYPGGSRTPLEEHLIEGILYARSKNLVRIHFSVSPEHKPAFIKHFESVKHTYEETYNVKFEINFSLQKESTDTIAVDMNNEAFRNQDGSILFRPGGHGALIENLNDLDADIIFVKNIDNIVPDKYKADTVKYKKVIAGMLIEKRNRCFEYLEQLGNNPEESLIHEVKTFLEKEFHLSLDKHFSGKTNEEKLQYLRGKLNRPLRVCGMVKNEGEPGGGPFFVQKTSGSISLQIVEGAQIDMNNPEKKYIVNNATHFNPVDLVLSVKDYKGNKYDLTKYVDSETGFISKKSKDGKDLKSLELPGLWNGAMADWNTIFVEVPISTFSPVKTVNDLLRQTHQG